VVTGDWAPPIIGWDNYVKAYQVQRARVTGGRMDRTNTYIKLDGNSAWATYQFYYVTSVDGKVSESRGHTTMILNKRGDRWVIVLNHSSIVDSPLAAQFPPRIPRSPAALVILISRRDPGGTPTRSWVAKNSSPGPRPLVQAGAEFHATVKLEGTRSSSSPHRSKCRRCQHRTPEITASAIIGFVQRDILAMTACWS